MQNTEVIISGGKLLAYIVKAVTGDPDETTFVTPPELDLQLGFIAHLAGEEIPRHSHLPFERGMDGTFEVLVVRKGRCEVDIYDLDQKLAASADLCTGDILVLLEAGHGFRMLEDTVFLEIKRGPYRGHLEKDRF
ncbi:MAG: hypothetical protein QOD75_1028 [Blastocatellia bacterium]|jgi:hypothetical protein|nr:hypothetical protein [Blastocatellia bacterium]